MEELVSRRTINRVHGKYYQSTLTESFVTGVIDHVNPQFAYVIVEGREEDVWVSSNRLNGALDRDTVKLRVFENNRKNRDEGEVVEIISRGITELAGKIEISKNFAFVVPNYRKMYDDVFVAKDDVKEAKNGEKVIVKIKEWPKGGKSDRNPVGVVTRVLGKSGDNDTEIHAIMFEYGLPFEFPKNVEAAANKMPGEISKSEIKRRRDMREVPTFTIDPATAKDFDDALSIRRLDSGEWEIGIHIADVSHYVKPDSLVDKEAFKRGTSVYLVDRTVPMLPERLSNELCSLRPKEEKLCFSAVFNITDRGKVTGEWFGRTIIFSDHRFTYEQAQEVLETGEGPFVMALDKLNTLARYLRGRRYRAGAISFETLEFVFELDEQGRPTGLFPKHRKDAHKLVEEFMLLANRKVAEWVYKQKQGAQRKTMVYRAHEDPDPEKVEQFARFAKRFGYDIQTESKALANSINQMVEQIEDRPEHNILQFQAIRTMAKARYTTDPVGHYGLAFKHYTHFTSPIRRYPDLMAHRLLQHYLDGSKSADKNQYEDRCKHSSAREKVAVDAERASIKYKQVEFMQQYLDSELAGVVSGVTEWGIYVEMSETRCEGMIRLSALEDDFYYFNEDQQQVVGKRTGFTYAIGDPVTVKVKNTNLDKRTIDLEMVI